MRKDGTSLSLLLWIYQEWLEEENWFLGGYRVLKIIILGNGIEQSTVLFQKTQDILRKNKVNCELAHTANADKLMEVLTRNAKTYDVLLIDIRNEKSAAVVRALRNANLTASVLLVGGNISENLEWMRYRLSGMVGDETTEDFERVLSDCCREQSRIKKYFVVRNKETLMRVDFDEIIYIESRQRIVVIHTKQRVIEFYGKLTDVFNNLPQDMFVRCHQSYVVNLEYVKILNKTERIFVMRNQEKIEISKSYYPHIQERLEMYLNSI